MPVSHATTARHLPRHDHRGQQVSPGTQAVYQDHDPDELLPEKAHSKGILELGHLSGMPFKCRLEENLRRTDKCHQIVYQGAWH